MMQKLLLPFGLTLAALGLLHLTKPTQPTAGGPPPAPGPQPPGPFPPNPAIPQQPAPEVNILRQEVGALLAQATVAPGTVKPEALDALETELRNAGLTQEADLVKAKSTELKSQIPVLGP
jgi:hypothetical protein